MDSEMSMILPKGILVNNENIYSSVAAIPTLPVHQVWQYWRVYTTTNKKLQDPTARRLENFWWHVLGSDRRHLSGHALAKIYEDISNGPTFVPLEGPSDRWEEPVAPPQIKYNPTIERERAITQVNSEIIPKRQRNGVTKEVSSSALRPPPAHPILKKPRGPSASGPRPTARFVSPQPSDGEEDQGSETSGSTITPGIEMRASVPSPPKKKTAVTKKFVASKAKKRPVLTRKSSSQSSAVSASDVGSSAGSRSPRTHTRPTPPIFEASANEALLNSNDSNSVGSYERMRPSAKALGKRPMVPRRVIIENKVPVKQPDPRLLVSTDSRPRLSQNSQPQISAESRPPASLNSLSTNSCEARHQISQISQPQVSVDLRPLASSDKFPSRDSVDSRVSRPTQIQYDFKPMISSKPKVPHVKYDFGPPISPRSRPSVSSDSRPPISTNGRPACAPVLISTPSHPQKPSEPYKRNSLIDLTCHARGQNPVLSPLNKSTDGPSDISQGIGSVPMGKSRSHTGYASRDAVGRGPGSGLFTGATLATTTAAVSGKGPGLGLFTGATATTSNIAAQGTIIDQSGNVASLPIPQPWNLQRSNGYSGSSSSSILDAHFTPTPPSTSANVPLGRTRSQLTLLLERSNANNAKKSRSKS